MSTLFFTTHFLTKFNYIWHTVSTVTRTQAGQSSVQISAIARSLTVLQISGPAQELIYSIDIGDYYPGYKVAGM